MPKKIVTTSLDADLMKKLKFLAVEVEKPLNALFEEALQDLLEKYRDRPKDTD